VVQPVADAVNQIDPAGVVQPVADAVNQVDPAGAVQQAGEAAKQVDVGGAVQHAGDAVKPVPESVLATADPMQPTPHFGPPAVDAPAVDAPVTPSVIPDVGTVPIPAPVADPVTPVLPAEVVQHAIAQPGAATDVNVTPLSDIPDGTALPDGLTSALDALGSPEVRLIVSGLVAATIARGVLSPSSIMFTNVRLLPCFMNATIHRSGVAEVVRLPRAAGSAVAEIVPARIVPVAGSIIEPIRDGFDRIRRGQVDYDDGDKRLLMQVGIALGTLYVAFLTVWFWATRLRWNGGWRAGS